MPKKEIDFSKTVIYKISCKDVNIKKFYIGHTTNFIKRKSGHKTDCNSNNNSKNTNIFIYTFIRDNGGWDNWNMEVIEIFPCKNINEASIRERYWIDTLNSSLNVKIPSRSKKEYQKEYDKNRRELKKDEINAKAREKVYCEICNFTTTRNHYTRHTKTERHKKNVELKTNNLERETRKTKVCCDICNIQISKGCLLRHKREQHEGIKRISRL